MFGSLCFQILLWFVLLFIIWELVGENRYPTGKKFIGIKILLFRLNDKFPTFNSDHSYIFKNLSMMAYITKIHK